MEGLNFFTRVISLVVPCPQAYARVKTSQDGHNAPDYKQELAWDIKCCALTEGAVSAGAYRRQLYVYVCIRPVSN
jgi:hypothetical protein